LFNKIEVSLLNKKFFCSSIFGLYKTKKINNEPKINTNKKIKIKIPLFGSFAKVCTEFNIPDRTKKVPHILNVKLAIDNIKVHDASRDLFSTIGMTGDWWSDKEGNTMTYCCIDTTSRDFARFGLLFTRNGMWQDTQVITQEWVTESTSPAEGLSYYGLHWWVYPVSMVSSGKTNMFAAQGLHTNDVWINQSLDLVVVRNSDYTRYGTDSIRTGSNIHSTNPPDSWDNTEFLTYITDAVMQ